MEAVALSQSVGDRWSLRWPLRNLGWLALERGDDGRVLALLDAQVGWHHERGASDGLVYLHHVLGALINAQGDVPRATALLCEALVLQQSHGAKGMIAESLELCAKGAVEQGQPARAARLLGAREALHTSIHWASSKRSVHEYVVAAARAQLAETSFTAAWAEGRAMRLEQAIAYALNAAAAAPTLSHLPSPIR